MTAQTTAERKASERARKTMLGLAEVRGLYLPAEERAKLARLGGVEWLRKKINTAKEHHVNPQSR